MPDVIRIHLLCSIVHAANNIIITILQLKTIQHVKVTKVAEITQLFLKANFGIKLCVCVCVCV